VRAEEDRRPGPASTREAAEQVAGVGADSRAGVVLGDLEPEVAQIARDAVGDGALAARWAGDPGELEEELERLAALVRKW
jgi:hypothetical protein